MNEDFNEFFLFTLTPSVTLRQLSLGIATTTMWPYDLQLVICDLWLVLCDVTVTPL